MDIARDSSIPLSRSMLVRFLSKSTRADLGRSGTILDSAHIGQEFSIYMENSIRGSVEAMQKAQ
jgi:hypothetical protein